MNLQKFEESFIDLLESCDGLSNSELIKAGIAIACEFITEEYDSETTDELIEKMKQAGELFEPRRGFVHKI